MKRYLFEGFLEEPLIYKACRLYWQVRMEDFFAWHKIPEAKPYLNTTFADGTDFFNGNPIVNYLVKPLNRAIRIIQDEANSNDIELSAWIDEFEIDDTLVNELVVSLQLRPYTEKLVYELLQKWFVDLYEVEKMEKFIELKIELEKLETPELFIKEVA